MRRGFSLVELSIVLVILGLLVGGILAGKSLIKAAELRSVSTDYSRFIAAFNAFRDKYFMLPGDLSNATSIWGAQDPVLATCTSTPSTTALTCNGNGDGMIENSSSRGEIFRSWQHLANAGMIEGNYTGMTGSLGTRNSVPGQNSPPVRIANASWIYWYMAPSGGGYYTLPPSNYLSLGNGPGYGSSNLNEAFTPEEAWNIDSKMDDGIPGSGRLMAYGWGSPCTLATSGTDYSAAYKLTTTAPACALMFRTSN